MRPRPLPHMPPSTPQGTSQHSRVLPPVYYQVSELMLVLMLPRSTHTHIHSQLIDISSTSTYLKQKLCCLRLQSQIANNLHCCPLRFNLKVRPPRCDHRGAAQCCSRFWSELWSSRCPLSTGTIGIHFLLSLPLQQLPDRDAVHVVGAGSGNDAVRFIFYRKRMRANNIGVKLPLFFFSLWLHFCVHNCSRSFFFFTPFPDLLTGNS